MSLYHPLLEILLNFIKKTLPDKRRVTKFTSFLSFSLKAAEISTFPKIGGCWASKGLFPPPLVIRKLFNYIKNNIIHLNLSQYDN